jgi:hypothetical protein
MNSDCVALAQTAQGEAVDLPVSLDDLMTAPERADMAAALERIARTRREVEAEQIFVFNIDKGKP